MKINKKQLKQLLDNYSEAESTVYLLEHDFGGEFGFNIRNSKTPNFYNKLNLVIFKLFEYGFGNQGRDAIEEYLFGEFDFEQLCKELNINE